MIRNKLNAKSVVLLHEYIHRDVYDTHQLRFINDAQLMTNNVTDDAFLQAMPDDDAAHRFFSIMEFCLIY